MCQISFQVLLKKIILNNCMQGSATGKLTEMLHKWVQLVVLTERLEEQSPACLRTGRAYDQHTMLTAMTDSKIWDTAAMTIIESLKILYKTSSLSITVCLGTLVTMMKLIFYLGSFIPAVCAVECVIVYLAWKCANHSSVKNFITVVHMHIQWQWCNLWKNIHLVGKFM